MEYKFKIGDICFWTYGGTSLSRIHHRKVRITGYTNKVQVELFTDIDSFRPYLFETVDEHPYGEDIESFESELQLCEE